MTPAYLTAPPCEDVCCDRSTARCTACRGQLDRAAYLAIGYAAAISAARATVRSAAASDAARDAAFAARVSSVDPGAPATPGATELTLRNR